MPDQESAREWAKALNTDMDLYGWDADQMIEHSRERGHMCGVTLNFDHPDSDPEHGVVVSIAGWVVGYDGSVGAWTAR